MAHIALAHDDGDVEEDTAILRPANQANPTGLLIRVRSRALALATLALLLLSEAIVGWARQCEARTYLGPAVRRKTAGLTSAGRALSVAGISHWRVVGQSATIRATPDLTSEIVARLMQGELVVALGSGYTWSSRYKGGGL